MHEPRNKYEITGVVGCVLGSYKELEEANEVAREYSLYQKNDILVYEKLNGLHVKAIFRGGIRVYLEDIK